MRRARRLSAFQKPGTTQTLSEDRDGAVIRRTVLPGGLRVVTERMPGARSAAVGIWVGVGSRDESAGLAGASHYLEHLLFKGTTTRSAMEIAAAVDAVGGELNAFTAKEHTCYYAHVLAEDLPLAVDLVSDVVLNATVSAADVDSERNVILEEIAMRDDDPTDGVHDLFSEGLFGDHPLGRPVLGTVASIEALRRDQIARYYRRRYRLPTMVVAAAGRLEHRTVVRLVRRAFGAALQGDRLPDPTRPARRRVVARARPVITLNRPTEQANLVVGTVGLARDDDRRFALSVLNNALGGGMSSRLFQEIREKRGLAYSVFSYSNQYADTGQFGVYVGCHPSRVKDVLKLIREQFEDVAENGLSEQEVARGKGQVRGGMVLGLEDPGSRMSRIGKGEIAYGDVLEVDELLRRVDSVTAEDVRGVAAALLRGPMCVAAIGPFDEGDFDAVR